MQTIVEYLRTNIMGRTLYTDELEYALENGALLGVYSDQMTFSNLSASPTGMQFDLFVVSRERLFESGADGGRGTLRKDFSGASHFRYELARRRSSGAITGFMHFVSSSLDAVPAEAMASVVRDIRLDGTVLSWQEKEMLYRDQPGPEQSWRAVAFEADCRFFVENGKARYEYSGVCLDVDTDDWSRRPSQAALPKFLSKEK